MKFQMKSTAKAVALGLASLAASAVLAAQAPSNSTSRATTSS